MLEDSDTQWSKVLRAAGQSAEGAIPAQVGDIVLDSSCSAIVMMGEEEGKLILDLMVGC